MVMAAEKYGTSTRPYAKIDIQNGKSEMQDEQSWFERCAGKTVVVALRNQRGPQRYSLLWDGPPSEMPEGRDRPGTVNKRRRGWEKHLIELGLAPEYDNASGMQCA